MINNYSMAIVAGRCSVCQGTVVEAVDAFCCTKCGAKRPYEAKLPIIEMTDTAPRLLLEGND